MQLLCKSRLAKLFLKLLRGTVVQKLRCEAIPQPLAEPSYKSCLSKLLRKLVPGIIVQGSSFEAISFAFSWNWRAKGISQSYLTKFYMELSRKSCQAEVLGAVRAMLGAVKSVCP